ncbi:polysaccharide pyruvyl transferase family protein [Rhodococcus sp. JVH1]|uniref:polysaccharide pyruvyl transferase family protein n=1 Tax=Rhodococcus sp. JVH1 TaxID=745408 RepID=UPI000A059626|nr:polysaccharide pyruvyl transferase family protein [Rhodococcus sp. JVH1]
MIRLLGGWGYENLGDEAILAGYVQYLGARERFHIASAAPPRTRIAQGGAVDVRREGQPWHGASNVLIGGGGYINGGWLPNIYTKLGALACDTRQAQVVAHGIEVRKMNNRTKQALLARVLRGGEVAVRDAESAAELERCDVNSVDILPDAISLLVPHIEKYLEPAPSLKGKILINLLDVPGRSDSDESELNVRAWNEFADSLLTKLGDRAVGLIVGAYDHEYMKRFRHLSFVEPRTVGQLLSVIDNAAGIVSVRMHPALLASAMGKPVVAIPYCGKVRPTLSRIGIHSRILGRLDVDYALDLLSEPYSAASAWEKAHRENEVWLDDKLFQVQPSVRGEFR